jgi:hypothetical protein
MRESEKYPIGVLIGGRDSGKTTHMKGNPSIGVPSFVEDFCKKSKLKGVIIIDTQIERDSYAEVAKISHPKEYRSGAVHLIVNNENKDEFVEYIRLHVKDTFVLIEDARIIVPTHSVKGTVFESLIIDSKNIHCTVWFMYHTFMAVPKELYGWLDVLKLFKVKQHPINRKRDITNYEEVLKAYNQVQAHRSPFYNKTLKCGA